MQFNSVPDIMSYLDATRAQLYARAEGLDAARENFRPAPDAWSVAEVCEHLSIIEKQMVRLVGMLAQKAQGAAAASPASFAPVSIAEQAKQIRDVKLQAPEEVRPTGGVALADSLSALRRTRDELRAAAAPLAESDASEVRYPHPFLGPLNAYEWLLFIGGHEERHLRQIENIIQASQQSN